jgi:hypothetical protein
MPLCGGFRIGVDISDPKMPPFVIVNVPPALKVPLALEVLPIKLKKPRDVLWGIWHPQAWTDARNWDELEPEEQQRRPMTRDIFELNDKAIGD